MPSLNAVGGLCICKTLPFPLAGGMSAVLLLTLMGQRLQISNLLSRQKVSGYEWDAGVFVTGGGGKGVREYQDRLTFLSL